MSNNPPMITSTELDIEHGLNTNSHSNLDDANNNDNNSNGNEGNNRNSNSNNNKDKRDRNSSYSSKRSSKGNGRRKKRERENQTTTRKRRKRTDSSNNNNHRNGSSSSNGRDNKYVSIKQDVEASVKGGSGSGYRMVLDEPVNKSMLSCHQCKNKKTLDRIIVCGHVYRINTTVKTCTKKYCKSCLLRFYLEAPPTDNKDPTWSSWKCPCCRYICCCAWCRKKKAKRLESVSNAIRAEAHRLTPAISLARKLVSESRVNNNGNNHHNHSRSSRNRNGSNHNNMDLPPQI